MGKNYEQELANAIAELDEETKKIATWSEISSQLNRIQEINYNIQNENISIQKQNEEFKAQLDNTCQLIDDGISPQFNDIKMRLLNIQQQNESIQKANASAFEMQEKLAKESRDSYKQLIEKNEEFKAQLAKINMLVIFTLAISIFAFIR
ncbi:MAG: hypothetical protein WDA26_05635 [Pusillimonas sp.]